MNFLNYMLDLVGIVPIVPFKTLEDNPLGVIPYEPL